MPKTFVHNKSAAKKILALLGLCISISLLSSCAQKKNVKLPSIGDYEIQTVETAKTKLKLGVVTGPYGDMFMEMIYPLLAEKGYEVQLVVYNNYNEPNFALADGEIDLNMFQHYMYLNNFKFENDLNLSAIAEIPTASMGIYSSKHSSIDSLEYGALVAVPNDSTNYSRALSVLDTAGLISIDSSADRTKITTEDLIENPKNLQFVSIDASMLVESLSKYDMVVINGNYAISGGLNLTDALFNETLSDGYINVIAVRTEDLKEVFVMDILSALRSETFKNQIMDKNGKYSGFQYPRNFINTAR